MEYNSSLPIYLQAANSIKQDIVTGKLSPGARLPSVRDLAVEYTINPNTVSRVYKELEMEGVCFTRRGIQQVLTAVHYALSWRVSGSEWQFYAGKFPGTRAPGRAMCKIHL